MWRPARAPRAARRAPRARERDPCSPAAQQLLGKHAAMLALAQTSGWTMDATSRRTIRCREPARQRRALVRRAGRAPPAGGGRVRRGGVRDDPRAMARAYARLAAAYARGDDVPRRVVDAIRERAHLFGGTDRFDTVMLEGDRRPRAREGRAEGVHSVALLDRGLGSRSGRGRNRARAAPGRPPPPPAPRALPRGSPPRLAELATRPVRTRAASASARSPRRVSSNATPARNRRRPSRRRSRSSCRRTARRRDGGAAVRVARSSPRGRGGDARRSADARPRAVARPTWVEEVLLQSLPLRRVPARAQRDAALRAVRGVRRRVTTRRRPRRRGDAPARERTCATVNVGSTRPLCASTSRRSTRRSPLMVTEGYGKVLVRPALNLARRELCVVARRASRRGRTGSCTPT